MEEGEKSKVYKVHKVKSKFGTGFPLPACLRSPSGMTLRGGLFVGEGKKAEEAGAFDGASERAFVAGANAGVLRVDDFCLPGNKTF